MKKNERAEIIKKAVQILKNDPEARPVDIARACGLWASTASNIYRDAKKVLTGEIPLEEAYWRKPKICGRPKRYIRLRIPIDRYDEYAHMPLRDLVELMQS